MEIGFEGAFDYWKSCLRDCVDRKIGKSDVWREILNKIINDELVVKMVKKW